MSKARRARSTEGRDFGIAIAAAGLIACWIVCVYVIWRMTGSWQEPFIAVVGGAFAWCAGAILFIRDPNKVMFDVEKETKT